MNSDPPPESSVFSSAQFSQVVFHNLSDSYPTDSGLLCKYSIHDGLEHSDHDRIGIFQVGWQSLDEAFFLQKAPKPTNAIIFKAEDLPKDDNMYQLCYITENEMVAGASVPFFFRPPQENELMAVEDSDNDFVTVNSNFAVVQSMNTELTVQNQKLAEELEKMKEELAEAKTKNTEAEQPKLERDSQQKNAEVLAKEKELAAENQKLKDDVERITTELAGFKLQARFLGADIGNQSRKTSDDDNITQKNVEAEQSKLEQEDQQTDSAVLAMEKLLTVENQKLKKDLGGIMGKLAEFKMQFALSQKIAEERSKLEQHLEPIDILDAEEKTMRERFEMRSKELFNAVKMKSFEAAERRQDYEKKNIRRLRLRMQAERTRTVSKQRIPTFAPDDACPIDKNRYTDVTITCALGRDLFFGQPTIRTPNTQQLYVRLQKEGAAASELLHVSDNDVCLANHDGEWYRARILEILSRSAIRVQLIDYGDVVKVPLQALREISEESSNAPVYCFKFRLVRTTPEEYFNKAPSDRLIVRPVQYSSVINGWIVAVQGDVFDNFTVAKAGQLERKQSVEASTSGIDGHIDEDGFTDMAITCTLASDLYFGQPLIFSKGFLQLHNRLQKEGAAAKKVGEQLSVPGVGDLCLVKHEDEWFRAKILSLVSAAARVQLVDYGDVIDTWLQDLKEISAESKAAPVRCFKFKLADNTPEKYLNRCVYDRLTIKCLRFCSEADAWIAAAKGDPLAAPTDVTAPSPQAASRKNSQNPKNVKPKEGEDEGKSDDATMKIKEATNGNTGTPLTTSTDPPADTPPPQQAKPSTKKDTLWKFFMCSDDEDDEILPAVNKLKELTQEFSKKQEYACDLLTSTFDTILNDTECIPNDVECLDRLDQTLESLVQAYDEKEGVKVASYNPLIGHTDVESPGQPARNLPPPKGVSVPPPLSVLCRSNVGFPYYFPHEVIGVPPPAARSDSLKMRLLRNLRNREYKGIPKTSAFPKMGADKIKECIESEWFPYSQQSNDNTVTELKKEIQGLQAYIADLEATAKNKGSSETRPQPTLSNKQVDHIVHVLSDELAKVELENKELKETVEQLKKQVSESCSRADANELSSVSSDGTEDIVHVLSDELTRVETENKSLKDTVEGLKKQMSLESGSESLKNETGGTPDESMRLDSEEKLSEKLLDDVSVYFRTESEKMNTIDQLMRDELGQLSNSLDKFKEKLTDKVSEASVEIVSEDTCAESADAVRNEPLKNVSGTENDSQVRVESEEKQSDKLLDNFFAYFKKVSIKRDNKIDPFLQNELDRFSDSLDKLKEKFNDEISEACAKIGSEDICAESAGVVRNNPQNNVNGTGNDSQVGVESDEEFEKEREKMNCAFDHLIGELSRKITSKCSVSQVQNMLKDIPAENEPRNLPNKVGTCAQSLYNSEKSNSLCSLKRKAADILTNDSESLQDLNSAKTRKIPEAFKYSAQDYLKNVPQISWRIRSLISGFPHASTSLNVILGQPVIEDTTFKMQMETLSGFRSFSVEFTNNHSRVVLQVKASIFPEYAFILNSLDENWGLGERHQFLLEPSSVYDFYFIVRRDHIELQVSETLSKRNVTMKYRHRMPPSEIRYIHIKGDVVVNGASVVEAENACCQEMRERLHTAFVEYANLSYRMAVVKNILKKAPRKPKKQKVPAHNTMLLQSLNEKELAENSSLSSSSPSFCESDC